MANEFDCIGSLIRPSSAPESQGGLQPLRPQVEAYGEELRAKRLLNSIAYRKQLTQLYTSQSGNCALCGTAITRETGWHDHHIVRRVDGGSNLPSNRVLLCIRSAMPRCMPVG